MAYERGHWVVQEYYIIWQVPGVFSVTHTLRTEKTWNIEHGCHGYQVWFTEDGDRAWILVTGMWLVYCVMAFCVCCDLPGPCSALMITLCIAATQWAVLPHRLPTTHPRLKPPCSGWANTDCSSPNASTIPRWHWWQSIPTISAAPGAWTWELSGWTAGAQYCCWGWR